LKYVFATWDPLRRSRSATREALLERVAPALLGRCEQLGIDVADEHAAVRSPSPFPLWGDKPVGLVNAWTDEPEEVLAALRDEGFEVHGWRVEESVPVDYGDNRHAEPRDWPDGQRSPGLVAVTFLQRPASLDREEWIRRWHGRMSSVSEEIQPRTRYVRNVVEQALTEGAPPYEGIVEECWADAETLANPRLFYGADSGAQVVRNMMRILGAVWHFAWPWKLHTVVMSEYLLKTR
jgi:hypothetical protein